LITNSFESSAAIVFATTYKQKKYKQISAFVVPMDNHSFSLGAKEDKIGIRASSTAKLIMDSIRIPSTNLLGTESEGFKIYMKTLDRGVIGIAGQALGIASTSIDCAVHYTLQCNTFRKPIAELQSILPKISKIILARDTDRFLTWRATTMKDEGSKYTREAEMANLAASELATMCAHQAIQVLAEMGYVTEIPAERHCRDAMITDIYEGTSDIQHLVIAVDVLKEYRG